MGVVLLGLDRHRQHCPLRGIDNARVREPLQVLPKRKLKECGGRAVVTSYSGKEYEVWAETDGNTFGCDALHGNSHSFKIFDVVVDFLRNNGGKAKKGTGRAPLGSAKCGLDTISGVILHEYFGVALGGSGFDPSFVVAAILEWAGIAKNSRGWLELRG